MSIDAMKTALDALEMLAKWEHPASNITTKSGRIYPHHVAKNSAATLRLAIEQAEKQEPVGQLQEEAYGRGQVLWFKKPADQSMLYTTPPQRQPLTQEGIVWLMPKPTILKANVERWDRAGMHAFARAIERAHGIGGGE